MTGIDLFGDDFETANGIRCANGEVSRSTWGGLEIHLGRLVVFFLYGKKISTPFFPKKIED